MPEIFQRHYNLHCVYPYFSSSHYSHRHLSHTLALITFLCPISVCPSVLMCTVEMTVHWAIRNSPRRKAPQKLAKHRKHIKIVRSEKHDNGHNVAQNFCVFVGGFECVRIDRPEETLRQLAVALTVHRIERLCAWHVETTDDNGSNINWQGERKVHKSVFVSLALYNTRSPRPVFLGKLYSFPSRNWKCVLFLLISPFARRRMHGKVMLQFESQSLHIRMLLVIYIISGRVRCVRVCIHYDNDELHWDH